MLCVELLYVVRHPHATDIVDMSRYDTIQSLIMFVAFLDWVRPGDGNYELCRKLKKVIRNILDYVLAVPIPVDPEQNNTHSREYESIGAEPFEPIWPDLNGPDWLSLLNTMDWTQGFGTEFVQ